jgi:hypothetical protein
MENSRFHKPISDHAQDVYIWFICIVKARRVNKDNRVAVAGMGYSDRSNICCERSQTMADGLAGLAGSIVDKLRESSRDQRQWIKNDRTVLFPDPVGPITLRHGTLSANMSGMT